MLAMHQVVPNSDVSVLDGAAGTIAQLVFANIPGANLRVHGNATVRLSGPGRVRMTLTSNLLVGVLATATFENTGAGPAFGNLSLLTDLAALPAGNYSFFLALSPTGANVDFLPFTFPIDYGGALTADEHL
jgi:hypothetical protein